MTPTVQPTLAPSATPLPSPTATAVGPQIGQISVSNPRKLVPLGDGKTLSVIAEDGLYVYDLQSLQLAHHVALTAPSILLDFSADGHTLAVRSDSGKI